MFLLFENSSLTVHTYFKLHFTCFSSNYMYKRKKINANKLIAIRSIRCPYGEFKLIQMYTRFMLVLCHDFEPIICDHVDIKNSKTQPKCHNPLLNTLFFILLRCYLDYYKCKLKLPFAKAIS